MKRSVESRAEKADRLNDFAVKQFHNDFKLNNTKDLLSRQQMMLQNVKTLDEKFYPKRKLKKTGNIEDEEMSVRVTLMEYGDNKGTKVTQKDASGTEDEIENILINNLLPTIEGYETDLFQKDDVFTQYQNLLREFGSDDKVLATQKQLLMLKETKESLEKRLEILKNEVKNASDTKESKLNELEGLKDRKEMFQSELDSLRQKHANEDASVISQLTELLKINEELKHNESQFKLKCKDELAQMHSKIEELNRLASDDTDEENLQQLEVEKQNLATIRLKLAKKNRQIVTMQRQLDNVPSRSEMTQYQRRFLELYNQVSAKQSETKKFYTLFNTLSDTKLYLEKEISLLNSIYENFSTSMNSPTVRDQFLKQFEAIVMGIKENKNKVTKRLQDEKDKKEKLNSELLLLLDQQRKYAAAIKKLRQIILEKQS